MPTDLTPLPTAGSVAGSVAGSAAVVLDRHHAADLADLLRCLRQLLDAEHDQLTPLLAKHDYDIDGLRTAVGLYASLLHTADDQRRF